MNEAMVSQLSVDKFTKIVKNVVKESLEESKIEWILKSTPYVSNEEQKEVEEKYGKKPEIKRMRKIEREIEV